MPPQKARHLTKAEIAANRAKKKMQSKFNRRLMRAQVNSEIAKVWPYKVTLTNYLSIDKFEMRKWFIEQQMRTYDPKLDNREHAHVMWSDDWKEFRFAREDHCFLFKMRFA
jgi:hypothetical protein